MARFCGRCGSVLDAYTGLCPQCDAAAYVPAPRPPEKKHTGLKVGAAAAAVILVVIGVLTALAYFDVTEIPILSDVFAVQRGDERDTKKTSKQQSEQDVQPQNAAPAAQGSAEIKTFTGVLRSETYTDGGVSGTVCVLNLDTPAEFHPFPPYDKTYGASVIARELQIEGSDVRQHVGEHVAVYGNVTFASGSQHRRTVVLENCLVEVTPSDDAQNRRTQADEGTGIPIYSVSCSSNQGSGKYGRSYGPEMAADGDFNTCWMVAGDSAGRGNWIQFDFGSPKTVSGVKLLNGNGWNGYYKGEKVEDGLFDLNGRICDFVLTFSDGTSKKYTASDVREESFGENIFYFDQPVTTQYIRLFIESGYEGSKWTTVACLSEFAAF